MVSFSAGCVPLSFCQTPRHMLMCGPPKCPQKLPQKLPRSFRRNFPRSFPRRFHAPPEKLPKELPYKFPADFLVSRFPSSRLPFPSSAGLDLSFKSGCALIVCLVLLAFSWRPRRRHGGLFPCLGFETRGRTRTKRGRRGRGGGGGLRKCAVLERLS